MADTFQAGIPGYTIPEHWRGVGFTLCGVDYPLVSVDPAELSKIKEGFPDIWGLPQAYSRAGNAIEVYPTPDRDLEMVQLAESPRPGPKAVRW